MNFIVSQIEVTNPAALTLRPRFGMSKKGNSTVAEMMKLLMFNRRIEFDYLNVTGNALPRTMQDIKFR